MRSAAKFAVFFFLLSITIIAGESRAEPDSAFSVLSNPVRNCRISDKPNDVGGALILEWELVPSISAAGHAGEIAIYRSAAVYKHHFF